MRDLIPPAVGYMMKVRRATPKSEDVIKDLEKCYRNRPEIHSKSRNKMSSSILYEATYLRALEHVKASELRMHLFSSSYTMLSSFKESGVVVVVVVDEEVHQDGHSTQEALVSCCLGQVHLLFLYIRGN